MSHLYVYFLQVWASLSRISLTNPKCFSIFIFTHSQFLFKQFLLSPKHFKGKNSRMFMVAKEKKASFSKQHQIFFFFGFKILEHSCIATTSPAQLFGAKLPDVGAGGLMLQSSIKRWEKCVSSKTNLFPFYPGFVSTSWVSTNERKPHVSTLVTMVKWEPMSAPGVVKMSRTQVTCSYDEFHIQYTEKCCSWWFPDFDTWKGGKTLDLSCFPLRGTSLLFITAAGTCDYSTGRNRLALNLQQTPDAFLPGLSWCQRRLSVLPACFSLFLIKKILKLRWSTVI